MVKTSARLEFNHLVYILMSADFKGTVKYIEEKGGAKAIKTLAVVENLLIPLRDLWLEMVCSE